MAASKRRLRWAEMPGPVREQVRQLVGAPVVHARNCPGGFSPGFASRLTLADGRRVFVKALDIDAWPVQAEPYRTEARVAAALPAAVAAPRFIGARDDGHWVILAFEDIDGAEPVLPWNPTDLDRVVTALSLMSRALTPSPVPLPREHPRLGGWAELAGDDLCRSLLPARSAWAAEHLDLLMGLEREGLAAARGESLVHFDLYPHNILLTPERVVFVDWPHARLGAPVVDLVIVLSSAAATGTDPEPFLTGPAGEIDSTAVDAVLTAHAGFCLAGGLTPLPPDLQPIADAKLSIGLGAVEWLRHRLSG